MVVEEHLELPLLFFLRGEDFSLCVFWASPPPPPPPPTIASLRPHFLLPAVSPPSASLLAPPTCAPSPPFLAARGSAELRWTCPLVCRRRTGCRCALAGGYG